MSRLTVILLALACAASVDAQHRPVRVFISADMEGVVGTVTGDQLGPTGFEYQRFREFMTREVLAAIRGVRAVGPAEIVVADAHGNGENLLIELFPPDVTIVRSWPRPLGMMQGIDSTFAAALFIGYHAGTTNPQACARTRSVPPSPTCGWAAVPCRKAASTRRSRAISVPVIMMSGTTAVAEVRGWWATFRPP
jgi:D-amino peptidase